MLQYTLSITAIQLMLPPDATQTQLLALVSQIRVDVYAYTSATDNKVSSTIMAEAPSTSEKFLIDLAKEVSPHCCWHYHTLYHTVALPRCLSTTLSLYHTVSLLAAQWN